MKFNVKLTPRDVAKIVNGILIGPDSSLISNISGIENGKEGDLTFVARSEYFKYMDNCDASCIIIPKGYVGVPHQDQSFVECENPYLAIVTVLKHIEGQNKVERKPDIHRSAVISPTAKIGKRCRIAARCVIGENVIIADDCYLLPNVILYENVIIGDHSTIHSNVVCYSDVVIGKRCIIHAGTVIGSDGFGYVENSDSSYEKIPQLGNVLIGDDVEIGANCTIDRAMIDSTIIEDGVKLDNLVHIAHNCFVGSHTAMAAQAGISGSSRIGRRNRIGGQVGVAGHLEVADDVVLAAKSGIAKTIREKGIYFGAPAKERLQAFKIEAYIRKLPEIAVDVEMLKKHMIKANDKEQ
ncbi:MAG: UDP-3-O-(3-hydroxymyristoyl)glucosamine N-acyltransferase [Ignavibacteria bacterium]|jgi:UDP-3-O-[3-hydroxymyristoyl] glucosamine N-acyltransferase|nr:UDP-3-O-(3-hydroxymyristoyl)glucosamine N-acyltransferase [Ignavibacteria bacterium]